jgi:hypothetical protein
MTIGIMQPYLFPRLNYLQLISKVDLFVVYDNIQYTKKGWINRNKVLFGNSEAFLTVPVAAASDYLDIRDRRLAANWPEARRRIVNRLVASYRKAPRFEAAFPVIEKCLNFEERNLFLFLHFALVTVLAHLGIPTPVIVSSTLDVDHDLRAESRVIGICKCLEADAYLNTSGGMKLYSRERFLECGLELRFLHSRPVEYAQFGAPFIPGLSVVDLMMFNSVDRIREMLASCDIDGRPGSSLAVKAAPPDLGFGRP